LSYVDPNLSLSVPLSLSLSGLEPIMFVCIVMEYCRAGDLHSRIIECTSRSRLISEKQFLKWSCQICSGMRFLHDRNILHRDVKSANIFLTKKGNVRIGDLGLARKAKKTAALTKCGTDCYMAPEMISGSAYGKKADVWSLGCVFFEMMSGSFMSELPGNAGAMVLLKGGFVEALINEIPNRFSAGAVDLVRQCLSRDPNSRYSIEDVISSLHRLCKEQGIEDAPASRSRTASVDSRPSYSNLINLQNISQVDLSTPAPQGLGGEVGTSPKKSSRNRRRKKSSSDAAKKDESIATSALQ